MGIARMITNKIYYYMKPAVPRSLQISLRRSLVRIQVRRNEDIWPISPLAGRKPNGWPGWPDGKKFAFVLTHDVDTARGHEKTLQLKDVDQSLGYQSSFNFVPERYVVSREIIDILKISGFEIGVHGLKHDGKLYNSKRTFSRRASRINHYLTEWGAIGFRSPSMHNNLEWMQELDIKYDSSTFDTDPFEPQAEGIGTIFPFWIDPTSENKILEIPYTLPQDFTLFILMRCQTIDIWRKKLDWICQQGGMAVLNVHPDYINFETTKSEKETYPVSYYVDFLEYVKGQYKGLYWPALPKEVYEFCENSFN